MSSTVLLGAGTIVFLLTVWATLAVGYSIFGSLYDDDKAKEIKRRREQDAATKDRGEAPPSRAPEDVAHDRPEDLV
ncbi:hypothetical protein [Euzebya tangerina]|uniref:hypothetical protein n=1 Tax=Euzebya tangerina TaxID=591198 RepID=UPI000E3232BB|nr:hypothetical protein [Euzebya tangerina]